MARQRRTVGSFIKLLLPDNRYAFGRILEKANFAFYDLISQTEDVNIRQITLNQILFVVAVYDDAITSGRWIKIGKLPLEEKLLILPMKFIQDPINTNDYSIYNSNTGKSVQANREDCFDLERAAVWEAKHVEERILDYFENRTNQWVERLKP